MSAHTHRADAVSRTRTMELPVGRVVIDRKDAALQCTLQSGAIRGAVGLGMSCGGSGYSGGAGGEDRQEWWWRRRRSGDGQERPGDLRCRCCCCSLCRRYCRHPATATTAAATALPPVAVQPAHDQQPKRLTGSEPSGRSRGLDKRQCGEDPVQ